MNSNQSILVKKYTGKMYSLVKCLRFAFIKTYVCGRTCTFSAHCWPGDKDNHSHAVKVRDILDSDIIMFNFNFNVIHPEVL